MDFFRNIPDNGSPSWRSPVDTLADLPSTGNKDGDTRVVLDTNEIYIWDQPTTAWVVASGGGGGAVTSVFGRTGAVVAVSGDYEADEIDYDNSTSGLAATNVQDAIDEIAIPGDIQPTVFSAANNQAIAADVTGFAFANGVVRSFEAQAWVTLDATTDAYESFSLYGIQKGASWDLATSSYGDASGVTFTITTAGQIQYTSANAPGFVSLNIKFRAWVVGV